MISILVEQAMTAQQAAMAGSAGVAGVATGGGLTAAQAEAVGVAPGGGRRNPNLIGPGAGMMAILKAIENIRTNKYKDHQTPDDQNCELFPYKDRKTKCPNGNAHHVIPDHCWRAGSGIQKLLPSIRANADLDDLLPHDNGSYYYANMNKDEGLSICVDGKGKTGTHGVIHGLFDPVELMIGESAKPPAPLYTAKLGDLEDAAAKAVFLATGCSEQNIKQQLRNYHNGKALGENTMLRADPFGKNTTSPTDFTADPVIRSRTGGDKL